jgi:hypothetical protein
MQKAKPVARAIAGAKFPTKPSTGKLILRNLEDVKVDPATAAVDEATGNIGKTAVANSLNRANAARPRATEPLPASRQLAAPEGRPAGMTLQTGETAPTGEGQIAFDPRKKQTGTRVVEGKGPGGFDLARYESGEQPPPTGEGELTQRGSHREPQYQYLSEPKPGQGEPAADTMTGGGTLILTDDGQAMSVNRARTEAARREAIMNDPALWDELPAKQQQQIQQSHADLTEQLRRYDDYAASQPHFGVHDVSDAVKNTDSLGEAGELLKQSHAPFWTRADQASNNEWTALREKEKWLEKKIYSENPVGNIEDLKEQLAQNERDQMAFFDKYRTQVSPEEWQIARDGYQDGMVLSKLHNLMKASFNGITREAAAARPSLQRVFKPGEGFNKSLEKFFDQGTNRTVLERTIGKEHMLDLQELGQLFNDSTRMERSRSLISHIGASIRRHRWAMGGAAGLAYGLSHGVGQLVGGAAAGGTVTGTLDWIAERLATDPEFANRFIYSVKNNVSPRFAAPLLAARIFASAQNAPKSEEKPDAGSQ